MKCWREKTMHNPVVVAGVLFHLFVHSFVKYFLSHRAKTFTHLNTSRCYLQCEKWNRQIKRSKRMRERSDEVVLIGIL